MSGAHAQCPASGGGTLTQGNDNGNIESPNSIACGGGDTNGDGFTDTTQNGWARGFSDANEGVGTPISIDSVTFGVQLATEAGIPLAVNLYLDADITGGANTPGGDAILAASASTSTPAEAGTGGCSTSDTDGDGSVSVTDLVNVILCWGTPGVDCPDPGTTTDVDGDGIVGVTDLVQVILDWGECPTAPTYFITVDFDPPVVWPAGCDLWIEVEQVENGQVTGYSFRPGGNATPDCGPSYLRSAPCGLGAFTDLVNIGFPDAHLIVSANYAGGGTGDCPDVVVCGDPAAGDCCEDNGSPGCDNLECCEIICAIDPFCCDAVWDGICAGQVLTECEANLCVAANPCTIATGGDSAVDGYLAVNVDEMGGHGNWDAGWEDTYNPVGPEGASNPTFSAAQEFYIPTTHRQVLTRMASFLGLNDDDSIEVPIISADACSDTNGDGIDDTKTTQFRIVADDGSFDLLVDLVQTVTSSPGGATLTQAYTFTDDGGLGAVNFDLYAIGDYDHVWGAGDFADDNVGTTYNGSGNASTYVYQMDPGQPETAVTMSILGTADYVGAKAGCDPDDGGPDPPFGFGSDTQEWDNYGLPGSWKNHVAGVGTGVNGDSGPAPACSGATPDGHIGVQQSVSVPMGGSASITVVRRYGSTTP